MRLWIELSGEHPTLPRAEALAALEAEGVRPREVSASPQVLHREATGAGLRAVARLGLGHVACEELARGSLDDLRSFARSSNLGGETFRTRVRGLGVDVDRAAVEGPLGADFGKTGRVDLSSPAVDFRVLVGTEFVLGRVVHRVDRSGLEARKVTNRAFRLPISLHPKLARALVNLSRVPTGGLVTAPLCGTRGVAVRASRAGARAGGAPEPGSVRRGLRTRRGDAGSGSSSAERVGHVGESAVRARGPGVPDAFAFGYVFETGMPDGNWVCFDNRLAPLGYSYLLIHAGRGTVASCMFTGFKREAEYVARTVAAFTDRAGLRMRNPRPFGGFANFRLPRTAIQGGHLVIGEHAGFQDALAGFGMRYAIRSGILAARSLIEGKDYTALWRETLSPAMRASVTNRLVFNLAGELGRRWMLAQRLSAADAGAELRSLYNPSAAKTLLFPIAYWRFQARLRDKSCDHVNCECVWCRCGTESAAAAS